MRLYFLASLSGVVLSLFLYASLVLAEGLRPFVLAGQAKQTTLEETVGAVKSALRNQGFELAGSYSPYENATIVIVTNDELKNNAAKSKWGGYGAAQRVAVTKVGDDIQVSYTNPAYMFAAYRMQGSITQTQAQLEQALGRQTEYGSEKGLEPDRLRNYNYMIGLEKFDSVNKHILARFDTHEQAVRAVELGLTSGESGVSKVYRIDIPGKDEIVIGVAIREGRGSDRHVMARIDFTDIKSTAHLPYEILVSGNSVYHLFGRFRITINFPDLRINGMHSITSILYAPRDIKTRLTQLLDSN